MTPDPPAALLSLVITPATAADGQRLAAGLDVLRGEDPTIEVRTAPATGQVTIGGTSELHLEVIVDRLAREFNVHAGLGRPQVIVRPGLSCMAEAAMKYARVTSDGGQYGHVVLRLSPRVPGAGYLFEDHVQGGAVPAQFIPAVDQGIQDVLTNEGFSGHPIADVRAELLDGSYHDVDSSDDAFRSAAALATRDALRQAGLVLLEPVMRVEVMVPPIHLADVVRNLVRLGGHPGVAQPEGDIVRAEALVRLASLFGYETGFRSLTLGRGACSLRFAGFAPVPPTDGEEGLPVGALLRPAPHLRDSGIALPEPDEFGEE